MHEDGKKSHQKDYIYLLDKMCLRRAEGKGQHFWGSAPLRLNNRHDFAPIPPEKFHEKFGRSEEHSARNFSKLIRKAD